MNRLRTSALALLAIAVFAAPVLAGPGHDHDHGHGGDKKMTTAAVGHAAPDFELVDHTGKTHKLSDYHGKTIVLEWTNPLCPFVVRHSNEGTMTKLVAANPDVVWLAIDSSSDGKTVVTAESASAWAEKEGIPYPILLDSKGKVGRKYAAKTTPHMYIINAEGTLVYEGAIDDDPRGNAEERVNYVAEALAAVKAGKAVETANTKPYGCSVKYGVAEEKQASASR